MVSLNAIRASNKHIGAALPPGLVAIFIGGTSGIGETSLKQFAKHANQPHIYFVGRSRHAGERITAELNALNPGGLYSFIQSDDLSLLNNIDDICREIKSKVTAINLLYLTIGSLSFGTETKEGLPFVQSLTYYCRTRFVLDLLPNIQQATSLRRVVTVFAGGKEGPIFADDLQGRHVSLVAFRGHTSSMLTLSLEAMAQKAPEVSFIQTYPGFVKTNISRGAKGSAAAVLKVVSTLAGPFISIPFDECGESHIFFGTSARFPPAVSSDSASGVPLTKDVRVAIGTNGESGSGVYSINFDGETASPKVQRLLADLRKKGMLDKVWKHTEDEFQQITGHVAA